MDGFFPRARRTPLLPAFILALLAGCGQSDAPDDDIAAVRAPEIVRILPVEEVLAGAHIPTLDPAAMNDAEIRNAIGAGLRCEFRYTSTGKPVLAARIRPEGGMDGGIVKLNGSLVLLERASVDGDIGRDADFFLAADPIRMAVSPVRGEEVEDRDGVLHLEANMMFEVGQSLRVGYRGYLDCLSEPPMESPPQ